jgi:DNA-binding NarL/FixJ family response regulator
MSDILQRIVAVKREEVAALLAQHSLRSLRADAESRRDDLRNFEELQRMATSPRNAVRFLEEVYRCDVCELAPQVRCPTLVIHSRNDSRESYEEGKLTASLIPGARFVTLESANHILMAHEPAWAEFVTALRDFLPATNVVDSGAGMAASADLSARERQVLELIAHGLGNDEIAEHLFLSTKTVRNHITHVFAKTGVTTRAQAIARARDAGFAREPLASVPKSRTD